MKLLPVILAAAMSSLVFPFAVSGTAATTVYQTDTGVIMYFVEAVIPQGTDLSGVAVKREEMEAWLKSQSRGELKLPIDQPDAKITNEAGEEITFHYQVDFESGNGEDVVQFALTFANLYSFAKFNNVDLTTAPKTTVAPLDYRTFVIWRTTTIPNPYNRYFKSENAPNSQEIVERFNNDFNGGRPITENFYVFSTTTRRTETNAIKVEHNVLNYEYWFRVNSTNEEGVILRDRFANTPIWYAMAIVATAVAMAIFYFVMKELEKRKKHESSEKATEKTVAKNIE